MTDDPAGVLPLDKPEGHTSYDMVRRARRALGIRRVGHTGTLDPFASGLLLLCVGWATRLSEYLTALPKVYRAVMRLGERTDTDDRTGVIIARSPGWRELTDDRVREALERQVGELAQMPPAFSAKKVAGQRAYAAARRGRPLALERQRVRVHRIDLRSLDLPDIEFEIECSSGTYVRAIARDVGQHLGVGAHLVHLRRTRVGAFDVSEAVPGDELTPERARTGLRAPECGIAHLPRLELGASEARGVAHGRALDRTIDADGPIAALSDGRLAAILQHRDGRLWPAKVFVRPG